MVFKKIKANLLAEKGPKSKTAWLEEEPVPGWDNLPSLESIEQFKTKYAVNKQQLNPLRDLFKDAPPAAELVKMAKGK